MSLPSEEDVHNVRESWTNMTENHGLKGVGLTILHALLNHAPAVRPLFSSMDVPEKDGVDLTLSDLDNKKVSTHAIQLARKLNQLIGVLDDVDVVVETCGQLGKVHAEYGVKEEHVNELGNVVLDVIGKVLDLPQNSEILKSWRVVLTVVETVMNQGIQDANVGQGCD